MCRKISQYLLLIDEIHLKPYFDYKGGNVVGSANNTNEVAASAFAFMLSSVLSNYKDVIHTGWNDKIVVLKKTTLQLYFKTFIEKINSGNLIM